MFCLFLNVYFWLNLISHLINYFVISFNLESALPERTMMPPPSSGRGGGRGGRGVKSKGAPIVAGNVGRGRGRGRGRGLPSVGNNLVTTSKASSASGSVHAHYSGIYMDDKKGKNRSMFTKYASLLSPCM